MFQSQKTNAFESARNLVMKVLPDASRVPVRSIARILQPVVDADWARKLDSLLADTAVQGSLDALKCNDDGTLLAPGILDLLCVGVVLHSPDPPKPGRLGIILGANAPLIGPQAYWLMDMGIALSTIADFAVGSGASFAFVDPAAITAFSTNGTTHEITSAIQQHKGRDLLLKLQRLAEAVILQQSLTYGDYTAQLVERALYNPELRSLSVDPTWLAQGSEKPLALAAMKANPILARNVVMLALRHAIEDSVHGASNADALSYRQTYYQLGLQDFKPQACSDVPLARRKLEDLFPKWHFEYRATSDERKRDSFKDCPGEIVDDPTNASAPPALGSGMAVTLGDFYVLVPSPSILARGVFEQSDSLRLALAYRDRISQALIDREIGETLKASTAHDQKAFGETAFGLLNDGWGWKVRAKSTEFVQFPRGR